MKVIKENKGIISIMIVAIAIRIYYFWITRNSGEWWDSLCYGSLAKNIVTQLWAGKEFILHETALRPLLFSYLWSALLFLGFNEMAIRITLVLIPSILSVFLVYITTKEIFNERVALISSFIYSMIWMNLFYSSRFLVHMLGLCFFISSIYFFVKSTKEEFNYKQFSLSLILLSLATLTRYQVGMIFLVYLLILILGERLYLNKLKFWIAGIVGISPMLIFFILNLINSGELFPSLGMNPALTHLPLGLHTLTFIPTFLMTAFFLMFLIGLGYLVFEIILSWDNLKNPRYRNSLLIVLILVAFFSFFIFYLRIVEDRWLFETLFSLSVISAYGIDSIANHIGKNNKALGVMFILIILFSGAYSQLTFSDNLINQKKDTYIQMKETFEYIKYNTHQDSIIAGHSIEPYVIYYAERDYIGLTINEEDIRLLKDADYLVMHLFNPMPQYLIDYIQTTEEFVPIQASYLNQQPAVILYRRVHD
jgi:hypothetical protein